MLRKGKEESTKIQRLIQSEAHHFDFKAALGNLAWWFLSLKRRTFRARLLASPALIGQASLALPHPSEPSQK